MLTSITPLGEQGRRQRWAVTATAYVLGSAAGGAVLGALLGLLGAPVADRLSTAAVLGLAALACAIAALSDARVPSWRLPGGRRQVDEDWLTRYRGWVYGAGFGLQLGLGVTTIVTSAATYALVVLSLLSGSWSAGLALGLAFGLVRALPILLVRGARSPATLRAAGARLERLSAGVSSGVVAVLALAAAVLLGGAVLA